MKNTAFCLVVAGVILASGSAFAGSVKVINTGADFKKFLDISNLSSDKMMNAWNEFETPYKEIYNSVVFDRTLPNWEENRQKKIDTFFSQLPALQEKMMAIFNGAEDLANKQEKKFESVFPDLQENVPVIFLPSVLSFNGKGKFLRSLRRNTLFIGVDMVAQRDDDLDVLFSHEFFHIYHFDKLDGNDLWNTMSMPLWFEGFATFVSGVLNPGKADAILLMDKDLAAECSKPAAVQGWAKSYLPVLSVSMNDPKATALYNDWFKMKEGVTLPKRRGYCLGMQALRHLSTKYTMQDMVTWPEEKLMPLLRQALLDLAEQK